MEDIKAAEIHFNIRKNFLSQRCPEVTWITQLPRSFWLLGGLQAQAEGLMLRVD